jgi:nucleotide-binding universal stress UspA family protein
MVSRILVPVDGSAAALRALEFAGARKRTAAGEVSILVLNVQVPLPPSRYVTRSMIREYDSRMSLEALRSARSTARRLKLGARFYVRKGDPATAVVRFAKTMRCGEIVMGTRGRGRTAVFVLGSVALRVVQMAAAPVTLIK